MDRCIKETSKKQRIVQNRRNRETRDKEKEKDRNKKKRDKKIRYKD